jgi:hypothetical protein
LGEEAKSDLARELDHVVSEYQTKPWDYWQSRVEQRATKFEHLDAAGKRYQVEAYAFWGDERQSTIQVAIAIQRSWWRPLFPRTRSFTVRKDRVLVAQ